MFIAIKDTNLALRQLTALDYRGPEHATYISPFDAATRDKRGYRA